ERSRDLARLCFSANLEVQLLKNVSELRWRIDVELFSGLFIDQAGQPRELFFYLLSRLFERGGVDANADSLHLKEHFDQRQLNISVDLLEPRLLYLAVENGGHSQREVCRLKRGARLPVQIAYGLLPVHLQVLSSHVGDLEAGAVWVKQV